MRDGFQMEVQIVPTETKIAIGNALISAGVKQLELTSFVSPKLVPQLSDAAELVTRLRGRGALLRALVPNQRGAERAVGQRNSQRQERQSYGCAVHEGRGRRCRSSQGNAHADARSNRNGVRMSFRG